MENSKRFSFETSSGLYLLERIIPAPENKVDSFPMIKVYDCDSEFEAKFVVQEYLDLHYPGPYVFYCKLSDFDFSTFYVTYK